MRHRRDLLSAGGLAVLAIAYLVANRAYSLDTLATPGPGMFPLAAGLLLLGLATCQAAIAVRARSGPASAPDEAGPAGRRVWVMSAVLGGYVIAAAAIGFLTASSALVLVTSRLLGAPDWLRPATLALGVTIAAYVIFVVWLGVPLPAGLLP